MLVLTETEIEAQEENLDADHLPIGKQAALLRVFRQYERAASVRLPQPAMRLAEVEGYTAQELLAVLARIVGLGAKLNTVTIEGVTTRNKDKERLGWAEVAVFTLWTEEEIETPNVGIIEIDLGESEVLSEFGS